VIVKAEIGTSSPLSQNGRSVANESEQHPLDQAQNGRAYVFEAVDDRLKQTSYGYFQNAWRYRAFFRFWVRRSLATRYSQTSLGWLWALLQPLLNSLIFIFVFSTIMHASSGSVPYPLFIVTNLILWNYFARLVQVGAGAITSNVDLLTRVQFPREFLPLAVWVEGLVDLVLGFVIVLIISVISHFPLSSSFPLMIAPFIVETMLALGLSFLLAALSVYVRDLLQITPLLIQLLFFLSPVIYTLDSVPDAVKSVYQLNPLGPTFAAYQQTLFYGQSALPNSLGAAALVALLVLIGGYYVFKRVEWHFVDSL